MKSEFAEDASVACVNATKFVGYRLDSGIEKPACM
jgi:hypothetical protein